MYVWFYNMKQFHSIFVLYDSDALFLVLFSYFSFDGVSHFISNLLSLDCTKLKCSRFFDVYIFLSGSLYAD